MGDETIGRETHLSWFEVARHCVIVRVVRDEGKPHAATHQLSDLSCPCPRHLETRQRQHLYSVTIGVVLKRLSALNSIRRS